MIAHSAKTKQLFYKFHSLCLKSISLICDKYENFLIVVLFYIIFFIFVFTIYYFILLMISHGYHGGKNNYLKN